MKIKNDILKVRKNINIIDKKIINLLYKRKKKSEKIAKIKIYLKKKIKDKNREKEILKKINKKSKKYNLSKKYIKKIFKTIIQNSVKAQKKIFKKNITEKIAFLGPIGSYSYYAYKKYAKKHVYKSKKLKYDNFKKVINSVENNESNLAILPLENINTGKILEIYKLLEKSNLFIIKNIFLKIEHCLLSIKKIKINKIKFIYTHIQAFLQCKNFIEKFCRAKIFFSKSTSEAIKKVIKKKNKNTVAIGSKKNKKLFNLKILKKNISNKKKNFTKFVVLNKITKNIKYKNNYIVLITFTYNENFSQHNIFRIFYKNNIKIKSINFHKSNIKKNHYVYFIEIICKKNKSKIKKTLKKIYSITKNIKILGNYKNNKYININ
ncbi:prephenate dehydratase domain-containing protein [Buchnera aphidicola (Ceratoglyphina bambusae)]|uniref:prephenate dehydratase domain-containing protein n=1 Tax=Buchnera aphidicola TaxID=9 RepID=UPI0031B82DFE